MLHTKIRKIKFKTQNKPQVTNVKANEYDKSNMLLFMPYAGFTFKNLKLAINTGTKNKY